MRLVNHTNINVELLNCGGTMNQNKKGNKTKMMFVTFMGLGLIAAGIKVARVIQEKIEKKKSNNHHEDCCG